MENKASNQSTTATTQGTNGEATQGTTQKQAQEQVKKRVIHLSVARGVRQNAKNNFYPSVLGIGINDTRKLAEALQYDHVAGSFKGNHRSNKNFIAADSVIMDCDNNETDEESKWITPESIKELLPGVEFCTCYSKSHNKDKNGKTARPRFHIIFPLDEIKRDWREIRDIKENLLQIIPDADAAAKDAARMIYGVESPEILYFAGDKSVLTFLDEKNKADEANKEISTPKPDASKQEQRPAKKTAKRKESNEVIPEGKRNITLYDNGIRYILKCDSEDDAKKLFWGDCQRCEPRLKNEECARIWESVKNSQVNKCAKLARELGDRTKFLEHAQLKHIDENIIRKVLNAVFKENNDARVGIYSRKKRPIDINIVKTALNNFGMSVRLNKITQKIEVDGIQEGNYYVLEEFHRLSRTEQKRISVNYLPGILYPVLQNMNYSVNLSLLKSYINNIAETCAYNPIEEILKSREWDGVDRLTELYKIMGVSENRFYCRIVKKWLIQAVAMALNDEAKRGCDFVLVLQGAQGIGKTEFFRNIAMRPEYFLGSADIDLRNKDSIIQAVTHWIVEIGEADSTFKHEQAQLKGFITNNTADYRMPYGETYEGRPRRTVFGATVNPEQFLKDITGGSRRWATLRINHIDSEKMRSLSEDWYIQLWVQVYKIFLQDNDGYRLDSKERAFIERENRTASEYLPGELELLNYLDWEADTSRWQYINADQFLLHTKISRVSSAQIGKAIRKIMQYDKRVKEKRGRLHFLPPFQDMEKIITEEDINAAESLHNNNDENAEQPAAESQYNNDENIEQPAAESQYNNDEHAEQQAAESQISIIEPNLTAEEFCNFELLPKEYSEIIKLYFSMPESEQQKIMDEGEINKEIFLAVNEKNGATNIIKFKNAMRWHKEQEKK